MDYLQILLKILIGAAMLVVYARLGGRSQIRPLSGTEVVSGMVVGALISGSLFDETVPVWALAAAILVWTVVFVGLRKWKSKRIGAELLVDGKAKQLVRGGTLVAENFEGQNLTLRDFETLIHQEGIRSLRELEDVWYEANGKLTILKKGEAPYSTLLVEKGQIYHDGLQYIGRDESWLTGQLGRQGTRLEEVFCAEWDNGKLAVYLRKEENL